VRFDGHGAIEEDWSTWGRWGVRDCACVGASHNEGACSCVSRSEVEVNAHDVALQGAMGHNGCEVPIQCQTFRGNVQLSGPLNSQSVLCLS